MNGRKNFVKYGKLINAISKFYGLLPKKFRKKRLKALAYKVGLLAMFERYLLIKTLAKRCGENVSVFENVFFEHIENLSIGSNVSIHQMCYIDAEGEIVIGDNVSIAHRTTILSSNHGYERTDIPIKYQDMKLDKTLIEENVWIGCGVTILAGVIINSGCVIGSNSTVTKEIPINSIAVGTPCKIIKNRTCTMKTHSHKT